MAQNTLKKYRMVVIGGSAGSLEVIINIVSLIPLNTDASFIIVLHRKSSPDSILEDLLSTKTSLVVKEVEDKEKINPGSIYIAPADYHLLLEDQYNFSLDTSEKLHFSRPSIDITFQSAAEVFGESLIGILLSGANADGAEGIKTIAETGGYTIVQQPSSAEVSYMPEQALNLIRPDAIIKGTDIGTYLKDHLV